MEDDLSRNGLNTNLVKDRDSWRMLIHRKTSNLRKRGKLTLNDDGDDEKVIE